jgi:hypothetical protein
MYTFYLDHFFIWQSDSIFDKKNLYLLYSFMKPYERYIRFVKNVDEQMTKVKVVFISYAS